MRAKITKKQVFSIPNIMSMFRLALIPLIVWFYLGLENPILTAVAVVVSGLTDVIDGYVARRFNMVTDVGKALDPFADKLTQIALLACLVSRFPLLVFPLCLMVVKEGVSLALRSVIYKMTGEVRCALWHGKANTVLLYTTMFVHIVWYDIPYDLTCISIGACMCLMVISFVLYSAESIVMLKRAVDEIEDQK